MSERPDPRREIVLGVVWAEITRHFAAEVIDDAASRLAAGSLDDAGDAEDQRTVVDAAEDGVNPAPPGHI